MSVVSFDTLEFVKELEKNGFTEQQAEALAKSQKKAFEQVLETQLATKSDTWEIKSKLKLHRLMLAIVVSGVIALVLKAFFTG